jgi:Amt family ammonium transporter
VLELIPPVNGCVNINYGFCEGSLCVRGGKFSGGIGCVSFVSQLAGSTVAFVFALTNSFLVYSVLNKTVGIRLDQEDEFMGTDLSIHKIGAYPQDSIR